MYLKQFKKSFKGPECGNPFRGCLVGYTITRHWDLSYILMIQVQIKGDDAIK